MHHNGVVAYSLQPRTVMRLGVMLLLLLAVLVGCSSEREGVPPVKRMFQASQEIAAEALERSIVPRADRRKRKKRWGKRQQTTRRLLSPTSSAWCVSQIAPVSPWTSRF